jgi:large subunit ribosomal protein L34
MSVTYQPKKRKRAKTHGFLVRQKTKGGKNIIKRRRAKGRTNLSVSSEK